MTGFFDSDSGAIHVVFAWKVEEALQDRIDLPAILCSFQHPLEAFLVLQS